MAATTQVGLAGRFAPLADLSKPSQDQASLIWPVATVQNKKGKSVQTASIVAPTHRKSTTSAQMGRTMTEPFKLRHSFAPAFLSSSSFPPLLPRLAVTSKRNNPPLQADCGLPRPQQSATSMAELRREPPAQITWQPPLPNLSKSYREVVAGSAKEPAPAAPRGKAPDVSFSSVKQNPLSSHQGEPALLLSKEDEKQKAQPFHFTLVGKFSNGKPPMVAIRKEILAASFTGEVLAGLLDYRHVFFKFAVEDDFHRMWSRRSWMFSGFQARIFRWSPDFCPDIESSVAPVWIRIPQLPLHCCDKESLFSIASAFGNPLKVDRATAEADKLMRPSEARVLVEMDVLQPRPHRVWIGSHEEGRWQHVEMVELPHYCTNCRKMGHQAVNCKPPKRKRETEKSRKGKSKMWIPVGAGKTKLATSKDARVDPQLSTSSQNLPPPNIADPLICGEEKMEHFITNLGQLLELINRQEAGVKEIEQPPLASTDHQNDSARTQGKMQPFVPPKQNVDLMNQGIPTERSKDSSHVQISNKEEEIHKPTEESLDPPINEENSLAQVHSQNDNSKGPIGLDVVSPRELELQLVTTTMEQISKQSSLEAIRVVGNWEEGEPSSLHKSGSLTDLTILQNIPTIIWDEGESSNMYKVNSMTDLAFLQAIPTESESEEDGEDCWTENSFEDGPEDELNKFIDKMEKCQKPAKQTKYMEALVSPKASVVSERKLRERNPFICYSNPKRWNQR